MLRAFKSHTRIRDRETASSGHDEPVQDESPRSKQHVHDEPRFWVPVHLRRRTLALFAFIFAAAAIALGILALYSDRNQGLTTANARDHYLWTYGPTAVFTVIAMFWSQTEYRSKQLQPWQLMRSRPQTAANSLLLDYVSPWNVFALLKSLRCGHFLAALGIAGSLLLKLVTIFSTGLFVLQNVAVTNHNAAFEMLETFGVKDPSFWTGNFSEIASDFRPVATVMGMAKDHLAYPNGTTSNQTFLQFRHADGPANGTSLSQASVDVFESTLDCELGTFISNWTKQIDPESGDATYVAQKVSSKSCTNGITAGTGYAQFPFFALKALSTQANMQSIQCAGYPQDDATDGLRMLAFSGGMYLKDGKAYPNITTLLCTPRYEVSRHSVSIDNTGRATVNHSMTVQQTEQIAGLKPWALANAFLKSIDKSDFLIAAESPSISENGGSYEYTAGADPEEFTGGSGFQLLNILDPQGSVSDWRNKTLLNTTLQTLWSSWTAQMASLYLKVPADGSEIVYGNMTRNENRLAIHTASLWSMEVILCVLFLVAIALALSTKRDILPRDPAALGGLASILAVSPEVQAVLKGAWQCSERSLHQHLAGDRFSTSVTSPLEHERSATFTIDRTASHEKQNSPSASKPSKGWWRPSATSHWYIAGLSLLILALIATLESLYQFSVTNNGLASVSDPDSALHFAWTTVPALIMVFTAAGVGSLHFAIQVLQPYQALSRGSASARTGLFRYPFSGLSVFGISDPSAYKEFVVALTTAAVLLSSLLTIVISGLYTTVPTSTHEAITIQQTDRFNHSTGLASGSPIQMELVTLGNLSYPRFTYEGLALPTLRAPQNATGSLNMEVTGLQGGLTCSVVPPKNVISVQNKAGVLNIVLSAQGGCIGTAAIGTNWAPNGTVTFASMYGGMPIDNYLRAPTTGNFGYLWGTGGINKTCPTMIGIVGHTEAHKLTDYTLFYCKQTVSQVQVNVTFSLPAMDIDLSAPPAVLNGTSRPFDMAIIAMTDDPAEVDGNPMRNWQSFNLPATTPNDMFGPFMNVLVFGTHGIPSSQLVGAANVGNLFSAVNSLWSIGMAQILSDSRVPLNSDTIPVSGSRIYPGSYRVVQSAVSTRILEGLLAAIFICCVVAFFAMGTGRILKQNPCSIAGMASLLVDSELLNKGMIPEGAEWQTDKQLLKAGVFDGWVFSLGWWSAPDGEPEQRFGVDVGKADRAP